MKRKAFLTAIPYTIPVLTGYLFLGMAYGIYMNSSGFSFLYPMLMSIVIFGGSLQFVAVTMLLAPFAPVPTFLMALVIQVRHLFYGISMLDKYKNLGLKKIYMIYMIFGLTDETFSVNYSAEIPEGVDRGWFMFFVTLLDQCYWITGSTVGGLLGSILPFDTKGIDFVMTAMFVVIFMEQWKKEKKHYTALIGLGCSIICLLIFGSESFMLPTLISILALLTIFSKPIDKAGGFA